MIRTVIESPYGSDDPFVVARNEIYLRRAMRDSLMLGEAPFASHGLYTQPGVLDDRDERERKHGIEAGLDWGEVAERVAFYLDYGESRGMELGRRCHVANGIEIVERWIGENP